MQQGMSYLDTQVKSDGKSYKRKAGKDAHPMEPHPRKLIVVHIFSIQNQQALNGIHSDSQSNSLVEKGQGQNITKVGQLVKRRIVALKPFNPQFSPQLCTFYITLEEQGLFGYIINYVCTQKQRQLESQYQDTSFLDTLGGDQLKILENSSEPKAIKELNGKFQSQKQKIKQPFDQNHRELLKKINQKE